MSDFSIYSTKSKYYDNSRKLVVGKMKDETVGVAIKEFVRLKPKMYSYLVNDWHPKRHIWYPKRWWNFCMFEDEEKEK